MVWRWHFYAGRFVLPFILILSVTGSIYLFKPQIERWEERAFVGLGVQGAVSADRQLGAAMAAYPGARFNHLRLPREPGDAAMIQLGLPDGTLREVYVAPQGQVLGTLVPEARIAATMARHHGSLLLGRWGGWLVELAASWTIIMIVTGLYLWWPRPFGLAGTVWPRLSLRGRPLLKDLHRVTGFWIAGLVLVMLASGLPWTSVWGGAFTWVRGELGWVKEQQDWTVGVAGGHAGHDRDPGRTEPPSAPPSGVLPLASFVVKAEAERMAYPVLVLPPNAPQAFGPPTENVWTIKSAPQNRPLGRQVTYDPATGRELGRSSFADQHPIDRVVNTGVAWHEGQLFGLANQLIGLLMAVALVGTSLAGVLMWLRRRPPGRLGSPATLSPSLPRGAFLAFIVLGTLLPLFGASLIVLALVNRGVGLIRAFRPLARAGLRTG